MGYKILWYIRISDGQTDNVICRGRFASKKKHVHAEKRENDP